MIISHDYGRTWDFGGWIISSPEPCWTTAFHPEENLTGGQDPNAFTLGAGDMTLYVDDKEDFLYIYYTKSGHGGSHIYAARAPKASNGVSGSWTKFYNGAFSEPGNLGQETPVCRNACEPCVVYSEYLNKYLLSSYNGPLWRAGKGSLQIAFSDDPVSFGESTPFNPERTDMSFPYWTMCNPSDTGNLTTVGRTFRLIFESNGTDLYQAEVTTP